MRARILASLTTTLGGLTLIASCADSPSATAPLRAGQSSALLGELVGGTLTAVGNVLVAPVHREVALANPVSWSFTVGSGGATSSNSTVGLTVSVPAGAVSEPVTITVTALAGTAVAYRFEPHGLQFARDVQLTQQTSQLDKGLLTSLLQGGHFRGDEPLYTGNGLALVTELVSAQLSLLRGTVSFPIRHFSGWIIASGRSGSETSDQ